MKSFKLIVICAFSLTTLSAISQPADTILLATYSYSTNTRTESLTALGSHLSTALSIPVKTKSYPTVPALMQALANDSVDIAMINTSGYLLLDHNNPGAVRPIVNLELENKNLTNYGGCIVTRSASGIRSLNELKKINDRKRFAFVMASSTSGNLVPRIVLSDAGVNNPEEVFDVYYAGTHQKVAEDVLTGKASFGGCSCEEVLKTNATLPDGNKLIVLGEFNNIPVGPNVMRRGLESSIAKKTEVVLLDIHHTNPEAFRTFCNGWVEFKTATRFRSVNGDHYKEFRNKFENNAKLWSLLKP